MQQASATELKLNKGYFGLVAEYRGSSEAIPYINNSNLEYQLSRVINKVAGVETPKIGFIAPGGNPLMGQGSQFSILKQELEGESFEVVELQPSNLENLDEYDMLVLIDSQNLDEEALFHIDQFVMNDGKLFELVRKRRQCASALSELVAGVQRRQLHRDAGGGGDVGRSVLPLCAQDVYSMAVGVEVSLSEFDPAPLLNHQPAWSARPVAERDGAEQPVVVDVVARHRHVANGRGRRNKLRGRS